MSEGTVATKNPKGFGFIKVEGREKDLFFHSNELKNITFDELQEGDKVSFEIVTDPVKSPKGPSATNVSKI